MDYSTVIALDAMGGDNAPGEIVKGAVDAVNERNDIRIQLYGDKDSVEAELQKYTYHAEQIAVIHTTEEISCDESPAAAIKKIISDLTDELKREDLDEEAQAAILHNISLLNDERRIISDRLDRTVL